MLQIIYQDEHLVVINKPHGLLVHRSPIAADAEEFAVQMLRDQIGQKVFPVHRIDRKTSGILVFGLNGEIARLIQEQLEDHATNKTYLAIVRGYFPESLELDYPLTNDTGKVQEALTHFKCLKHTEVDVPFGKHATSRYSLIEAYPKTGRMHQIRKHLKHLRHPIIGDRPHGCNKQNRLFKAQWNMTTMMLHAQKLNLSHPITNEPLHLEAPLFSTFKKMIDTLKLD